MIKLFEEYNEYYHEISNEEYGKYNDILPFNVDEIKRLERVFKDHSISVSYNYDRYNYNSRDLIEITVDEPGYNVVIYKCLDEWYLCYLNGKNYKCDQLEGLIKLIEDIC